MALSAIGIIEQQAIATLETFGSTLDSLLDLYHETGDSNALKCYQRLLARYQQTTFAEATVSGGKGRFVDGGRKLRGVPYSENNSEKPSARKGAPEVSDVLFTDRVKNIIRKAATKNGQTIDTNARAHTGSYKYNINADVFCKSLDKMTADYSDELKTYLGGTMKNVQVTRVCHFIGQVLSMNVINDSKLQLTDITFAFADYYKLETVKAKLSVKRLSYEEEDFFAHFKRIMKSIISLNNLK